MKNKILSLLLVVVMALSMVACGGKEGVSQAEYDKVVKERDELKKDYDFLLELYSSSMASNTIDEILEDTRESDKKDTVKNPENSTNVYSDDKVKISFAGIGEKGVEFWVENLTDVNITIQADSVSVNGISTSDITMSDDVAPKSTGKVIVKCEDFSQDTHVESVGGQLRIIDFNKSFQTYNATFVNVTIE